MRGKAESTATAARVNGITTQVAAGAVESLRAAEELNAQAGTLGDTVAVLQLEDPGVGRGRPVRRATATRSSSRVHQPASAGWWCRAAPAVGR